MNFITIAFLFILDLALAAGVAIFNPQERLFTFFLTALALIFVPSLFALWGLIKFWLGYHAFLKERLVRVYLSMLHKHGFPSAAAYFDANHYLSGVMDDPEVKQEAKLKAAVFLGELEANRVLKPWSMGIASPLALQEAMARFKPEPQSRFIQA